MAEPLLQTFSQADDLVTDLAAAVARRLSADIAETGVATLVVSGGKTPVPFFKALAQQPIAWDQVNITLADERWVDADDDASNERLVRTHLLQGEAANARFVPLKTSAETPAMAQDNLARELMELPARFSVCVLGMGEDGHTASLFPDAENLSAALHSDQPCIAIRSPSVAQPRMSLTMPRLLATRQIYIHIQGKKKREIIAAALENGIQTTLPITYALHQHHAPVRIYWAP